jgi:cell division protein FtsW (lipid II flippase)
MTNLALYNIPFYVYEGLFTFFLMVVLGLSYIKVSKSNRSGKRFEHTERFGVETILMFAFGGAVLFVLSFVRKAVTIPSSFFFKVVMFVLMIGVVFVIALANVGISMFASNIAVNIAEKDLER